MSPVAGGGPEKFTQTYWICSHGKTYIANLVILVVISSPLHAPECDNSCTKEKSACPFSRNNNLPDLKSGHLAAQDEQLNSKDLSFNN